MVVRSFYWWRRFNLWDGKTFTNNILKNQVAQCLDSVLVLSWFCRNVFCCFFWHIVFLFFQLNKNQRGDILKGKQTSGRVDPSSSRLLLLPLIHNKLSPHLFGQIHRFSLARRPHGFALIARCCFRVSAPHRRPLGPSRLSAASWLATLANTVAAVVALKYNTCV